MPTQLPNRLTKDLANAEVGKIRRLSVPERAFLTIDGTAQPGMPEFQGAIKQLYGLAYAIKFLPKRGVVPPGYEPYSVGAFEALYDLPDPNWKWTLLLPQPDFVSMEVVAAARQALRESKKPDMPEVQLVVWREGESIQTLHIGPYSQEQAAVDLLMSYLAKQGYRAGRHHEIYLNDPRRVGEDKAKTVIRYAISAQQSLF